MVKIMIVDDDILALTKLREMIRIEKVRIVGEFRQPEEALKYIEKQPVDILITDMKMPRMSGIELIKLAKNHQPHMQIIAISSYKDFDYVKESFKEGSIDYILKHALSVESLTSALLEAIKRIKKSGNDNVDNEVHLERQNALKEKLFIQLFNGEIKEEEIEKTFKKLRVRIDITSTILIVCEIDDYMSLSKRFQAEDKRIFFNAVRSIIEKAISGISETSIITIKEGTYVVLLSYTDVKSQLYMYSMSREYCNRISGNIKKMLNIELSIGMGKLCISYKELKATYDSCVRLLGNKFFEGKGKVYSGYEQKDIKGETTKNTADMKFQGAKIYQKLISLDKSCLEDIKTIFHYYRYMKLPSSAIELSIIEMLNAGYKVVDEKHLYEIKRRQGFQILYNKIKQTETMDEIRDIILLFYTNIVDGVANLNKVQEEGYNKYTIQAVGYIKEHYQEAISLQSIAEDLNVHYAYLSKVFKEDTGSNFSKYLNEIRIQRAKDLIESKKYRIKEVYTEVGFNQYNYFFRVFKQVVGCTPIEYEKKC